MDPQSCELVDLMEITLQRVNGMIMVAGERMHNDEYLHFGLGHIGGVDR